MILKDFKKYLILIYIGITVIFFVLRIVFFAASFGGVEHDSGWYLGVAKNLAQRGIYASYTNTIREEGVGAHPSIHGRFSVQDKNGFSYFPAGVTVGPGYVVPEALLLKIFGNGWWQYRLWPLIGFTGLLFLLFYIVWRIGGMISLLIFQIWLWSVPQFITTYAYEAYSEHIATFFLLLSFLFYYLSTQKYKKNYYVIFVSGIFFSFSFLTKNLFLLPGIAFLVPFFWEAWTSKKKIKTFIFRWGLFFAGLIFPFLLYESYQYFFLISQFGNEGWQAVNKDFSMHFQSNGSGLKGLDIHSLDWKFIFKKLNIWLDVGIFYSWIIWLIIIVSPFVILRFINKHYRLLIIMFYTAFVISFTWFVLLSSTGWARHAWQGIMLGMVIVSMFFGIFFTNILNSQKKSNLIFVLLGIFLLLTVKTSNLELKPFLDQNTIEKWRLNRYTRGLEGFPSTPILSLKDQINLVSFFNANIKQEDKIYYAGWFIHAELGPLVDKVFYTLDRYFTLNQKNPSGGKSYLILGPYQQGPWSFEPPEYIPRKISELCINVVFKNPSYILCELKTGLVYNNPAY